MEGKGSIFKRRKTNQRTKERKRERKKGKKEEKGKKRLICSSYSNHDETAKISTEGNEGQNTTIEAITSK